MSDEWIMKNRFLVFSLTNLNVVLVNVMFDAWSTIKTKLKQRYVYHFVTSALSSNTLMFWDLWILSVAVLKYVNNSPFLLGTQLQLQSLVATYIWSLENEVWYYPAIPCISLHICKSSMLWDLWVPISRTDFCSFCWSQSVVKWQWFPKILLNTCGYIRLSSI